MTGIRILVADDHAIMRDGIRALLASNEDIEIVGEAADGKEAIERAGEISPDIIIMDISMPRMDGLEAMRRIKKKQPNIKTLVLTQHDNQEYIISIIRAGAAGYLPKKAVSSDLIAAIRAIHQDGSFLYPTAASILINSYLNRGQSHDIYDTLTAREREVLKLVAEGHTSQQIADMLFLSVKTVTGHRNKLMQKLDLHNRSELVRYAMRKGLITTDT
jgi:DNA-binding NarL/FixJ family response regulator